MIRARRHPKMPLPQAEPCPAELTRVVIAHLRRMKKEQTAFERQPTLDELMMRVIAEVCQEDSENGASKHYHEAEVATAFREVIAQQEGKELIAPLVCGDVTRGDSA